MYCNVSIDKHSGITQVHISQHVMLALTGRLGDE